MNGDLIIRNKTAPLILGNYEQECFLSQGDMHIVLIDHRNLRSSSEKIPCININIPAIVFLSPDTQIVPCDITIEAT